MGKYAIKGGHVYKDKYEIDLFKIVNVYKDRNC